MSNSYFQFKEFIVNQEHCAMKVSTDACIQGAWTPVQENVQQVLDIGTGTGLLSLMLAQRNAAINIQAVELDKDATRQAAENVSSSPWADRITVDEADIRTFQTGKKFDLIICNPPFFNNSLLGDKAQRNTARHTLSLTYEDLVSALQQLLVEDGYASILLPYAEHLIWEELLNKNGWSVFHKLNIVPVSGYEPNRVVSLCSKDDRPLQEETLVIRKEGNEYTDAFKDLLRPFYLHF